MPHARSAAEVVEWFATDAERGLSEVRAAALRAQKWPNERANAFATTVWQRFFRKGASVWRQPRNTR
jgi:transposase